MAQALLEPFDLSGRLILADKGYDSDKFVHWIEERGGIVVIPSRICAKRPRNTDWHTYKERHLVENLFLKLKNYRRFATRYEKKALYFLSCGCLPCVYPCLVTLIVLKQTLRRSGIVVSFRRSNGERLICLNRVDGVDDLPAEKIVTIDPVGNGQPSTGAPGETQRSGFAGEKEEARSE